MWEYNYSNELYHYGVLGMKWGVRRYQNEDGTLTAAGRRRYGSGEILEKAKAYKEASKTYSKSFNAYDSKRIQAYSLNKDKRAANTERFNKAVEDSRKMTKAQKEYKDARKAYRQAEKEAKAETHQAENEERSKNNEKLYKAANEYRESQSDGKKFVKDFLLTPAGRQTYDMARVTGHSQVQSWVESWFDINASTAISSVAGASVLKLNPILSTAANYATQYGVNEAFESKNKVNSLQQRALAKEYAEKKKHS